MKRGAMEDRMQKEDIIKILKFGCLSLVSCGILLGLTTLLVEQAGWEEGNAYGLALLTTLAMNFLTMRRHIFPGARTNGMKQGMGFLLMSIGMRGGERLMFALLHDRLGIQYQVAVLVISILFVFFKFCICKYWIFRDPLPTQSTG
jgi:putative flippase GtrA